MRYEPRSRTRLAWYLLLGLSVIGCKARDEREADAKMQREHIMHYTEIWNSSGYAGTQENCREAAKVVGREDDTDGLLRCLRRTKLFQIERYCRNLSPAVTIASEKELCAKHAQ
jgi:hypothetical protein